VLFLVFAPDGLADLLRRIRNCSGCIRSRTEGGKQHELIRSALWSSACRPRRRSRRSSRRHLRPHRHHVRRGQAVCPGRPRRSGLDERERRRQREEDPADRRRLRLQIPRRLRVQADDGRRQGHPDHAGHGDTEGLKAQSTRTRSRTSRRLLPGLADPSKTPYNFFVGPTYSDDLRAWLKWVKEDWKDKCANRSRLLLRRQRVRKSPSRRRRFCKDNGIDLVDDGRSCGGVPGRHQPAPQHEAEGADYAYINVTPPASPPSCATRGSWGSPQVRLQSLCFGETLPQIAREAAEG